MLFLDCSYITKGYGRFLFIFVGLNNLALISFRNPQVASTWNEVNTNSNTQCGSNNRDGRPVNSNCEINNRSAANIRALNMPPLGMIPYIHRKISILLL